MQQPWHRTPAGGLAPGYYPSTPGYIEAARRAHDTDRAVPFPPPDEQTAPAAPEVKTRTKRRYAHELYPHPPENETRPLAVEVPYLYARALGMEIHDTGWMQAPPLEAGSRTHHMISARHIAFLADALAQGLTGDAAWTWADERASEPSGEWVWERATHHGVDPDRIKPYPCGPTPTRHPHVGPKEVGGRTLQNVVTFVDGTEDDCPDCTEPAASTS